MLLWIFEHGLYKLQVTSPSSLNVVVYHATLQDWHVRLGHPNYSTVRQLVHQFQLPCTKNKILKNKYEACCLGKLHCLSLPLTHHRSTSPLQLIYSDVWGPAPLNYFSRL